VRSVRRLSVILIAEELNINKERVREIVADNFGIRKFSANIVPRNLTDVGFISDLLHNAEVFDRGITGEWTWCFQCNPEKKRQIMHRKT
jgi:hypothetical protein